MRLRWTWVLLSAFALRSEAQELEPGAYSVSPVGVNFLVATYNLSGGDLTFDPALPVEDAEATIHATAPVRSPFRANGDFAFQKSATADTGRATFRLEIINVFDRPNFGGPNIAFGTGNFGRITRVSGFARTFQFTFRFDW